MAVLIQRSTRYFRIAQIQIATAFSIPEPPIAWAWEGHGVDGNLIARRPDIETPNSPGLGITRVTERYVIIPFPDIYKQFFTTIPTRFFERVSAQVDGINILFVLNLEE